MRNKEEFDHFDREFLDDNEAVLFRLGLQAMEKDDFMQAISMIDASYKIKPTFEKNKQLAKCYFKNNESMKAYETIRDFYDDYHCCMGDALFLLSVLEDLKFFVPVHQVYAALLERFPEHRDEIIERERTTNILENDYTRSHQKDIQMMLSICDKMDRSDMDIPLMIYVNVKEVLPLDQYIRTTKDWLVDERMDWMLRTTVLEDYARLGLSQPFPYLAYPNRVVDVVPSELPRSPYHVALFQQVLQACEEIANQRPDVYELVKDEAYIEFACLYPFAHEFLSEFEIEEYVDFLVQQCSNGIYRKRQQSFPQRYFDLFQYIVDSEKESDEY